MTFLSNLPTLVLGTSVMKVHWSGSHQRGTRSVRKATRSAGAGERPGFGHDGHQRALGPLRVGDGDDGRLEDVGMGHDGVLELDRGDPLAAGLDDVLGAVRDRHVALAVERADVAGAQPAVVELRRVLVLVVRAGDPRATDLELADRLAVVGQHRAVLGDDAHLDAADDPAGLDLVVHVVVARRACGPGGSPKAASGLVSVMPQPWMMVTPKRFSNASISDCGHGGPAGRDARARSRSRSACRARAGRSRWSARRRSASGGAR